MYPISSIQISIKRGKVFKIIVEDFRDACPEVIGKDKPGRIKMDIESDTQDEEEDKRYKNSNNVYCPTPHCQGQDITDRKCDFKLFVSWLGSDKNHKKLISTSERFMVYSRYNLKELYSRILDISKVDEVVRADKKTEEARSESTTDQDKDKDAKAVDPLQALEPDVRKRIEERVHVTLEFPKLMAEI